MYEKLEGIDTDFRQKELYFIGSSRIGTQNKFYSASGSLLDKSNIYELKDHLGNVRQTLKTDANGVLQNNEYSRASYYPFGMKMPELSYNSYRFGYQGEYAEDETDPSSGGGSKLKTNNFKLRLYDARIGRWLTIDPKRQFSSPYLAMGNNPISSIDPDGGACFDADGNPITCPKGYEEFDNLVTVQYFDNGTPISLSSESSGSLLNIKGTESLDYSMVIGGASIATEIGGIAGLATVAAPATSLLFLSGGGTIDYSLTIASANSHANEDELSMTYVQDIAARKNRTEYFLHYGNKEKIQGILSTGVIPTSPGTNKVYLTTSLLTAAEAFAVLFLSQETHRGRGEYVTILKLHTYQKASLEWDVNEPFEFIHIGPLKPQSFLYIGPNPFGGSVR